MIIDGSATLARAHCAGLADGRTLECWIDGSGWNNG